MAIKSKSPGAKALLRRYGHRLEAIRQTYEDRAADLRREARRLESDYKVLAREFRRDVAKLKRAGVIAPEIDARRVRPTSALSRAMNDLGDILAGRSRAVKVSPEIARKLRAEDVQVVRGRAVLSPRYTIRRGEVVEKTSRAEGMQGGGVVKRIRLHTDYEARVSRMFKAMGPDDYVGIDLGNNFSRLFGATELEEFLNYLEGGDSFHPRSMRSVAVLRLSTPDLNPYYREMARRALARGAEKQAARAAVRKRAADAARAAGRDKRRRAAALRKSRRGGRGSKNYG